MALVSLCEKMENIRKKGCIRIRQRNTLDMDPKSNFGKDTEVSYKNPEFGVLTKMLNQMTTMYLLAFAHLVELRNGN